VLQFVLQFLFSVNNFSFHGECNNNVQHDAACIRSGGARRYSI
jgi:hypothetical protein